jgi:hypothetical protein
MPDNGFIYWITLKNRRGEPRVFRGSLLPGFVPQRVIDLMLCEVVEDVLDLCRLCDVQGQRCHVIEEGTGRKYCPVLFADAVRPGWAVADVL